MEWLIPVMGRGEREVGSYASSLLLFSFLLSKELDTKDKPTWCLPALHHLYISPSPVIPHSSHSVVLIP